MSAPSLFTKTGVNRFGKIGAFERIVAARQRTPNTARSPGTADNVGKLLRHESFELDHETIVPQELVTETLTCRAGGFSCELQIGLGEVVSRA